MNLSLYWVLWKYRFRITTRQLAYLCWLWRVQAHPFFGRNWFKEITLDWKFIHQIANNDLEVLLSKYKGVLREELGTLKGSRRTLSWCQMLVHGFIKQGLFLTL